MPPEITAKVTATCDQCGRTVQVKPTGAGEPAVPRNWKKIAGRLLCRDCVAAAFVPRVVWLPVGSACNDYCETWNEEQHVAGWRALRAALRTSWRTAAQLYNWASAEFLRSDTAAPVPSKSGKGLVPGPWDRKEAMNRVRALVGARFPDIDQRLNSQSKYAIIAAAEGAYFRTRFDRQILCASRVPEVTAGKFPVPVPAASINRLWIDQRSAHLRLSIAGQRFTIRLQGGRRFWRQVTCLEQALAGNGRVGELKIQERGKDVMIGFAVLLPRESSERCATMLRVCTCKESLWQVFVGDREESWDLHEDSVRQAIAAHRHRLRRMTDDLKMERRRPHRHSVAFDLRRQAMGERYRNRLHDHAHKAAALLEGLAVRSKACRVEYNDTEPIFGGDYPAFKLRNLVAEKLGRRGIEFVHVNGPGDNPEESLLDRPHA